MTNNRRGAAVAIANKARPDLRAKYVGREVPVPGPECDVLAYCEWLASEYERRDPRYAGFTDYLALVVHIERVLDGSIIPMSPYIRGDYLSVVDHIQRTMKRSRSEAVKIANRARPDLRAKYAGRAKSGRETRDG